MKVTSVECDFMVVPIQVPVTDQTIDYGMLLVTIEMDNGIRGTGIAREHDFHALSTRQSILNDIAPFLMRDGAADIPGQIWNDAGYQMVRDYMSPTGVVARASSAVDQALWDIRGQALGEPVYRLLGGVQPEIEIYVTFGLNWYTPEEEEEAALRLQRQGHKAFKLMGADADRGRDVSIDAARVKRLREVVGDDARIILDGRNVYSLYQATELTRLIAPYNMAFFDEPVYGKDPQALVRLRTACPGVPLAGRGRGGHIWDNRDLITSGALDVMGLNVLDQGGYTQAVKVCHLAEMYQLPVVTGGGWYLHNAHLLASVPNGWMTEFHVLAQPVLETIFVDPIMPQDGKLRLSDKPGLGLTLNEDAVREARQRGKALEEHKTTYRQPT